MTEDEIIDKAEALPERFADRLTESALWSVRQMRGGGEYGLLTIEIAASLAKHNTPVTPEERDELRELLEAIDRTDTGVLSAIWDRLASFLELHAAAEEAIFYPALLQVGLAAHRAAGVGGETLDAIHDHNEIRDAVTDVARHQVGTDEWFGAVAAANLANSDHMAEEEREGLTDFRRLASLQRRHQLAVAFTAYEARNYAGAVAVDKDPVGYVREVEEEITTPRSGSLSIGSLKRQ